jgi:hypothetical protein
MWWTQSAPPDWNRVITELPNSGWAKAYPAHPDRGRHYVVILWIRLSLESTNISLFLQQTSKKIFRS